jgi:hypothetical protein
VGHGIGLVGPIRLIELATEGAHGEGFGVVFIPGAEFSLAEEILKIQQQFFQAGTGDIYETQLGLAGGGGSPAAFGDVLPTAARSLHHLVVGTGTRADEAVAEGHGGIIDKGGDLVGTQFPVTAARAEAAGTGWRWQVEITRGHDKSAWQDSGRITGRQGVAGIIFREG